MRELKRVIIAGEGGQGVQVISKALVDAAHFSGLKISLVSNYGVEQRGGVSLGYIQISNQEIGFPKFQYADILVILTERAVSRVMSCVKKDTVIVYDKDLVLEESLNSLPNKKISVSALALAKEKMSARVFNVVMLGAILKTVEQVTINNVKRALAENLAHVYEKHPEMKHFNERALELGISSAFSGEKIHA